MSEHPFDRLFAQVDLRKDADPTKSYTAKLIAEGTPKCAKKVGEEAVDGAGEDVRRAQAVVADADADIAAVAVVV